MEAHQECCEYPGNGQARIRTGRRAFDCLRPCRLNRFAPAHGRPSRAACSRSLPSQAPDPESPGQAKTLKHACDVHRASPGDGREGCAQAFATRRSRPHGPRACGSAQGLRGWPGSAWRKTVESSAAACKQIRATAWVFMPARVGAVPIRSQASAACVHDVFARC